MRSERCRTSAMSSSSSTTSTRTARREASTPSMVRGDQGKGTRARRRRAPDMAARSSAGGRRRPKPPARSTPRLEIRQHHLDLLGLAFVALAVLMAFVTWLDWDGGAFGRALVDGTRWLVGSLYVGLPVALMAAAASIVLRPELPAGKPLRLGALLLFAGLALVVDDGGAVGRALEDGTTRVLGEAGPQVVAVFFLAGAALLLTGASVASIVAVTSSTVTTTSRRVRQTGAEARATVARL